MKRSFRKLDHSDFASRVVVVQKAYNKRVPYARRRDKRGERPVMWFFVASLWSYAALYVAFHRSTIEAALRSYALPPETRDTALACIGGGLTVSLVFLLYHLIRAVIRARRYYNSGSILAGFMAAAMLFMVPGSIYESAYAMLDKDTQRTITQTMNKVRGIDWERVVLVSSGGR